MFHGEASRPVKVSRGLLLALGVVAALILPSAAGAAIPSVFGTVTCTEQTTGATTGQRFCGNTPNTTAKSFDGTPIDVSVGFPVASGSDNNYPVVGIYHGWGST